MATSQYNVSTVPDTYRLPSQMDLDERHISQSSSNLHMALQMPRTAAPAFDVPAWPTFMTESWYQDSSPKATTASGQGITHGETSMSLWTAPFPANSTVSPTSSAMFRSSSQLSRLNQPSRASLNDTHPITKRQATYYLHENKFSHSFDTAIFDVDISDAMVKLARMKYGLRLRRGIIETNNREISLDTMIYREGPLFMENDTMAGFLLATSQDLLQILAGLLHHQDRASYNDATGNMVLVVRGVYCQLLSFYELFIELLTSRLERRSDPMVPIPGFMLNGEPVVGLNAQGALFCNTSLTLLERLETLLGTGPNCGEGLLSAAQVEELWDMLDTSVGMASDNGIMRPGDIQKLFAQVRAVLEKVSIVAS